MEHMKGSMNFTSDERKKVRLIVEQLAHMVEDGELEIKFLRQKAKAICTEVQAEHLTRYVYREAKSFVERNRAQEQSDSCLEDEVFLNLFGNVSEWEDGYLEDECELRSLKDDFTIHVDDIKKGDISLLAHAIRTRRKRLGISREELAKQLKVEVRWVIFLENGLLPRKELSDKELAQLAQTLQVDHLAISILADPLEENISNEERDIHVSEALCKHET